MTALPEGLLLSWYGDDFTGSSAVLEALSFAGLDTVMFLGTPTASQVARFPNARAIGIAGTARSRSPAWMRDNLPEPFAFLTGLNAPVFHYKICSTLDSSPSIGSIGQAIDIGLQCAPSDWVPLLPASPPIGRYQAFGHLFAAFEGEVFRLDRHPVMSRHPMTPMPESDVRRHVGEQTDRPFGLVDTLSLQNGAAEARLDDEISNGAMVIAVDVTSEADLREAGKLLWTRRGEGLFAVGSQGVEHALIAHWRDAGLLGAEPEPAGLGSVPHLPVVSGSVSQVTAGQIAWALDNGFAGIAFDAASVAGGASDVDWAVENATAEALRQVGEGRSPLVHAALGPDDPAYIASRAALERSGISPEEGGRRIGDALGRIIVRLMEDGGFRRIAISGGDTSGHATQRLGVFALTAAAQTVSGAALFAAHAEEPRYDGLEIALKGGQMGTRDYFGWIREGGGSAAGRKST